MKYTSSQIIILAISSIVLFMELLDGTIINTAIPSIAATFHINPIFLKLSVTSYLMGIAIFMPISGWCVDRFGAKNIFILSILVFIVASLLCALSHSTTQLTIFRFIQGIGGSFMTPVVRIVVVRLFPPTDLLRVQSMIFTPALLGLVLGPFFGGLITSYFDWQWIFYINIPIGICLIIFGRKHIEQLVNNTNPLDAIGFIMMSLSLSAITFFVEMLNHYSEWITRDLVYTVGIIGVVMFVVSIFHCMKKTHPIFDFTIFFVKTFRVGFIVNMVIYILSGAIAFMLPLLYQNVFHLTPLMSGLLTLPIAIGYMSSRILIASLVARVGFRYVISIAALFDMIWIMLLGNINHNTSYLSVVLLGFAHGATWICMGAAVGALNYVDIPRNRVAMATSIDITFRQFAISVGVGGSAFLLTSFAQLMSLDVFDIHARAFHYTFFVLSLLLAIPATVAMSLRKLNE